VINDFPISTKRYLYFI